MSHNEFSDSSLPLDSSNDGIKNSSNGSLISNPVVGLKGNDDASYGRLLSWSSERVFDVMSNQNTNSAIASLNANPRRLSVYNDAYAGDISHISINLSDFEFQKPIKKKHTHVTKPKCRIKLKRETRFKANQKEITHLANPYFNFLRAFRVRHSDEPQDTSIVRKSALFWNKLNTKQRALFKPHNLNRGISALSILVHLEYWKAQQENKFKSHHYDDDDENEESCCPKRKRKPCAKKRKPSCPRRKKPSCRPKRRTCRPKKRPCKPKRRSCKPKKRSCRPKRPSCKPKKRVCRPKPKCKPKRRC